jgi:hypothetical protein
VSNEQGNFLLKLRSAFSSFGRLEALLSTIRHTVIHHSHTKLIAIVES